MYNRGKYGNHFNDFSAIVALTGLTIGALIYTIFSFFSVALPLFLNIVLAMIITSGFFACLYWLSKPFHSWFTKHKKAFENIWKVIFYLFFFPPLAVIYVTIFLLPFMLIIGLTNNIWIGAGALVLVVSLLIFTCYYQKQKNELTSGQI